jgi:hypothetical protein
LLKNKYLHKFLEKVLLRFTLNDIKKHIKIKKLKTIIIDIDQMPREVFGKQEGVAKGYSPRGKGHDLYQVEVWTIRELKMLLKVELRSGSTYSGYNFLSNLKIMLPFLKELNIEIIIVADSGYENKEVMAFLEDNDIKFIFSEKQHKTVKKRGKYAKNKTVMNSEGVVFKKRFVNKQCKAGKYRFKEIFVQAHKLYDINGQLYFDFMYADEFTNSFITNLNDTPDKIYELYKKHAQVETIIEELRNDFGLGQSHNKNFYFNQTMTEIIALAYNIKTMYIRSVINNTEKEIMKLSTLQKNYIHIPAIIVNNKNKIIPKLSKTGFEILKPVFIKLDFSFA